MPDIVTNNDIDAEVSNDEAFTRYAIPSVSFMVLQQQDFFDASILYDYILNMEEAQAFTDSFLAPFREVNAMENGNGADIPWVVDGKLQRTCTGNVLLQLINPVVFPNISSKNPSWTVQ